MPASSPSLPARTRNRRVSTRSDRPHRRGRDQRTYRRRPWGVEQVQVVAVSAVEVRTRAEAQQSVELGECSGQRHRSALTRCTLDRTVRRVALSARSGPTETAWRPSGDSWLWWPIASFCGHSLRSASLRIPVFCFRWCFNLATETSPKRPRRRVVRLLPISWYHIDRKNRSKKTSVLYDDGFKRSSFGNKKIITLIHCGITPRIFVSHSYHKAVLLHAATLEGWDSASGQGWKKT